MRLAAVGIGTRGVSNNRAGGWLQDIQLGGAGGRAGEAEQTGPASGSSELEGRAWKVDSSGGQA